MENEEDDRTPKDPLDAWGETLLAELLEHTQKLNAIIAEVVKVRECQQAQDRTLNTILIRANAIHRRGQTRRDKE